MTSPTRPRPWLRLALAGSLSGLAALAVLGLSAPALAQTGQERIATYDVALAVQRDGSVQVIERIDYDFGSNQRHGIYRDIPVRFHYDDRYDRIEKIDKVSVQATGASGKFKVIHEGNLFRIRIGDPNRTVTGRNTYTIGYRVRGALNGFSDHDELYWNAVGTEWSVPIDAASVQVTTPAELLTGIACFAGSEGSNLPCVQAESNGGGARFGQPGLGPYEGVTVVAGLPRGVVPAPAPILKERFSFTRAFSVTAVTGSVAGALLLLLLGAMGRVLWRGGRDRRAVGSPVDAAYATPGAPQQAVPFLERPVIPVEYAPPDGIRPGQVGTLIDEVANPLDVTATIVDLAVQGYLRIEEIPKHGWFGKPDWRLVKLKDGDGQLLTYEHMLFDALFEDSDAVVEDDDERADLEAGTPPRPDLASAAPLEPGLAAVKLSSLRTKFVERLHRVQQALYVDAVREGWFADRPDKVRKRWRAVAVVALVAGIGLTILLAATTHLALIAVPFMLAGLVLLWGAHLMPRRTAKGTGLVRRVRGFRTYIDTAEAQEARFDEKENIFARYLPYAVVFGLTEKWARAFAVLGQEPPPPSWYVGTRPFALNSFASSIDHFTVSSAGTMASTPGGSGGSGFGGSVGGGGGGGGGGSW